MKEELPIKSIQDRRGDVFHIFKIHEKDAWSLCDLATVNEDRFLLYFPKTTEQNMTPDLSKHFAKKKRQEFDAKEEFLFTVKPRESRKVIGLVYIKELDWEKKQGELAYCIDYNYEGKGISSAVVSELTDYAFSSLGLETLQIIVHKTNLASVKLAEKCKFIRIKTLPEEYTPRSGKPMDMELYERYKE